MNAERLLKHFERISEAPDAIARLRRFILDLAVQGKLVEQDPNDEPALELLKRIQAEKARLVKKGEIRKQDIQLEIDPDGIPFTLPKCWAWARLGDVIHLISGQHLQPGEYSDQRQSGPPYITGPADFGRDGLVITRYAVVRKAVAKKGQILLTVKGAGIGKTAICNLPEVAISRQLMAMTAIDWSQRFLLLTTHRLAEELKENARSLIPGISREDVEQFVFLFPPLAEQHRIVAKVDELMALCNELDAAREKGEVQRDRLVAASLYGLNNGSLSPEPGRLEFEERARFYFKHLPRLTTRPEHIKQLRQTILNLAVQGKLVPQDPNDEPAEELLKRISKITRRHAYFEDNQNKYLPFELSQGWYWSLLGLIATKTGSGSTPRGGQSVYKSKGIPFLRSQNVYSDGLRLNDVAYIDDITHTRMSGTVVEPGDLLLNITGGSIGRCCRIPDTQIQANISQHVAIIRLAVGGMRDYLHKVVLSPFFQSFIIDEQTGAGRGGLPKNRMDRIPVPIPPLAEQHRIVAKVDELMALCDELEIRLATASATHQKLLEATLQEALTVIPNY